MGGEDEKRAETQDELSQLSKIYRVVTNSGTRSKSACVEMDWYSSSSCTNNEQTNRKQKQ